jgi:DNA adenine methylase
MISYIGGKKFHAKYISPYFPEEYDGYCEPFSGAFWVYLQSKVIAKDIIYNDANPHMVNLFCCCSSDIQKMRKELLKYPPQIDDIFNECRDYIFDIGFCNKIDMPNYNLAAKYAYIQTQVFSGNTLCDKTKMTNLKGKYKSKYEHLIDKLHNDRYIEKIQNINDFNVLDFVDCIDKYDREGMLFYIDPPYYNMEHYYTIGENNIHERLSERVKSIKGKFIISYYEFDKMKKYYPNDEYIFETYNINSQNSNRLKINSTRRDEVLIKNF